MARFWIVLALNAIAISAHAADISKDLAGQMNTNEKFEGLIDGVDADVAKGIEKDEPCCSDGCCCFWTGTLCATVGVGIGSLFYFFGEDIGAAFACDCCYGEEVDGGDDAVHKDVSKIDSPEQDIKAPTDSANDVTNTSENKEASEDTDTADKSMVDSVKEALFGEKEEKKNDEKEVKPQEENDTKDNTYTINPEPILKNTFDVVANSVNDMTDSVKKMTAKGAEKEEKKSFFSYRMIGLSLIGLFCVVSLFAVAKRYRQKKVRGSVLVVRKSKETEWSDSDSDMESGLMNGRY